MMDSSTIKGFSKNCSGKVNRTQRGKTRESVRHVLNLDYKISKLFVFLFFCPANTYI